MVDIVLFHPFGVLATSSPSLFPGVPNWLGENSSISINSPSLILWTNFAGTGG